MAVIDAALTQFGISGTDSTSVEVIARRARVSSPYVHRLFGAKSELLAAAIGQHTDRLLGLLRSSDAGRGLDETSLHAMSSAYHHLLQEDLGTLRRQMHVWGSAHDPAVTAIVQSSLRAMWAEVEGLSGAGSEEVRRFMADTALLTVLASLDLMDLYAADPST